MGYSLLILFIFIMAWQAVVARACEWSGYVDTKSNVYINSALYTYQHKSDTSLGATLELICDSSSGNDGLISKYFARSNGNTNELSHADIRELYWWKNVDRTQFYFGIRELFWGVVESAHLVNVINQNDTLEHFDGEQKLGQPMIQLSIDKDWGVLDFFALLGFRERAFPGKSMRLRSALVVDDDMAIYQSSKAENHIDLAARWSHVIGSADIGVSYFSGTHRTPQLLPVFESNKLTSFQPYYAQMNQIGLDLQLTVDDWLWKLEGINIQERDGPRNTAFVGGVEYTAVGIAQTSADLGYLVEYQFDDRKGLRRTTAQNDVVLGVRWTRNDFQSTEVLAAIVFDLQYHSRQFSIEASRRLSESWVLESEIRLFSHTEKDDLLHPIRRDDYWQLEIKRYF